MPNRNYIRGRAMEYKCMQELTELKFICWRTPGSKSCVDVIAMDINGFKLIQVKRKKSFKGGSYYNKSDPNIVKLIELEVPMNCHKEIWIWSDDKKKWFKKNMAV